VRALVIRGHPGSGNEQNFRTQLTDKLRRQPRIE
jgi:hypothetical protein